ncbi:hypothetical protein RB653_001157 [Dictyostelium firmibasis]|uniref:FNIP repeat-containing protein n=1 Tax=Dictyostelium firmibasis TaxID=79012 RepID=A0AAN7TWH7_9MYCE
MKDELFFNIWRNKFIRNEISKQLLFIVNEFKSFNSKKEIIDYEWIEFVKNIQYRGKETLEVGDLPTNGIIYSLFYSSVGEILPNSLPQTIRELEIDFLLLNHYKFIRDTIPNCLRSLTITSFIIGHSITICSNCLPETLKSLVIVAPKLFIEDGSLPNSLESLYLMDMEVVDFKQSIFKDFEKSELIDLSIQCENGTIGNQSFSNRLTSLIYSFRGYSSPTLIKKEFFQSPSSIEFLEIRLKNELQKFGDQVIPITTKNLHISLENSDQKICKNLIPQSVESLGFFFKTFRPNHDLIEPFSIPLSVKKIEINENYNVPIKLNIFPQNLKELKFCCNFNQPLDEPGIFPNSLTSLVLPRGFNQNILPGVLPSSLEYLWFFSPLLKPIESNILPSNLKALYLKEGLNLHDIISNPLSLDPSLNILKVR